MIDFIFETKFPWEPSKQISSWIDSVIRLEGFETGEITYTFCDDEFLHKINVDYLQHDTLTDIITFDYVSGKQIHADIFISVERVKSNAEEFGVSFDNELLRVLIHGILHLVGYGDKTQDEIVVMRQKEEFYMGMFDKN